MLNKAVLIGRLTSNIEIRKTSDGIPYTYFTLAVNRQQSQNDRADFISCVAWRNYADLMFKYLKKGSLIAIEGRIEVYRIEKDGLFETRTTINVQNLVFLDKKSSPTQQTQEIHSTNIPDSQFEYKEENVKDDFAKTEEDSQELNFDSVKF